jgi:hypothetical protein
MEEGTMTHISLSKGKGKNRENVSYKGRHIGDVESYKHRTGTRWGSTTPSGEGTAGNRHKEDSVADLRWFEAQRLKDKRKLKEELAKKDYDKDGKVESPKDEVWGSRLRAAKMAGKLKEEEQIDEISKELAGRYAKKAYAQSRSATAQAVDAYHNNLPKTQAYHSDKSNKRGAGLRLAIDKLSGRAKVSANEETDYSAQDRAPVTKSAPKEDPSTPKSYPGAASTVNGPNPTSQRMQNAVKPKLQEAVSRKHFQQVADLIKGHESQEKRNELASHHAGIFAKQNPRFNHEKFHAAAGSTAHQPKKMDEAAYSAKAGRAGKDLGKPGKMFAKIASKAGKKYGSEERGKKVAGAILAKIRAKHMKEDQSF